MFSSHVINALQQDNSILSHGKKEPPTSTQPEPAKICDHRACGRLDNSDGKDENAPTCRAEDQFGILQDVLRESRLPSTVDRTKNPRTMFNENDVTIVVLGEMEEGMPPFMEANKQYPGGAVFALTMGWVTQEPSKHDENRVSVYIHKAISADAGGQTYLDIFTPPRRATYIINHLTTPVTYGRRHEGDVLEQWPVDCPKSSSMKLNCRADNKLFTRIVCAEVGVTVPVSLGLWFQGDVDEAEDLGDQFSFIKVLRLASQDINEDWLEPHVQRFVNSEAMRQYQKVVVKPFGPWWNACQNVTFHSKTQVLDIVSAILSLLQRIHPGDGILVESFFQTMEPLVSPYIGRHAVNIEGIYLGLRARVVVSRTAENDAQVSQILCGIGDGRKPIGGLTTVPITLELMLRKWGIIDPKQQKEIRDVMMRGAERLLLKMIEKENKLTDEEKGGPTCQTETIGIDYVFTRRNHVVTPVVIEVNAQDCLWVTSVYEWMNPEKRGTAARVWVQNAIARSQRFLMKNKKVLVIGAGGFSKRKLWKDAADYGARVVLVESNPEHFAQKEVYLFMHYDFTDHTRDEEHADAIAKRIIQEVGGVDGCLAIWEDCVPLVSLTAERLNLKYTSSYEAAMAAKDKLLTLKTLSEDSSESACSFAPSLFSSPAAQINSPDEVQQAVEQVCLPAVLKLEYGSSAVAMRHVFDAEEAQAHVEHVQSILKTEEDYPGVGLGHGQSFLLMARLLGTEHDVDVVMFEGQLMAAFVSDNGPTHVPLCFETCAIMPTVLDKEEERILIGAAEACCRSLGLKTGVYNVEMIFTPRGPRLIEINARMGGFYLRDWVKRIYQVDLFHLSMMACCGVRPVASNSPMGGYNCQVTRETVGQLMGLMLYPSRHEKALMTSATIEHLRRLHKEGSIFFIQLDPDAEKDENCEFEEPFASLSVHGRTLEAARAKLVGTCTALGLETDETLSYLLQDFCFI